MKIFFFLFLILFCLNVQKSAAQEKQYRTEAFWYTWGAEYHFKHPGIVFYEGQVRTGPVTRDDDIVKSQDLRLHNTLGYHYRFHDRWGAEGSVRGVFAGDERNFFSQAGIYHDFDIKGFIFSQEIGLGFSSFSERNDQTRVYFCADLRKAFPIGNQQLEAALGFEVYHINDIIDGEVRILEFSNKEGITERRFDKTRLRAEVGYRFIPELYIGFFAQKETDYLYRNIAVFDQNNKLIAPKGDLNIITPTFGATVRYAFSTKQERHRIIQRY